MTQGGHEQDLRNHIQKILESPAEIERWLDRIDNVLGAKPTLGLFAVDLLTETAAQAESSAIGPRLLEAANAIREGKATSAEPSWMRYRDSQMGTIKPPPPDKQHPNLDKVEVSRDEFRDIMFKRDAREDPDAKGCERGRGGRICWLAPDGRIAGVEACEFDGRGEYHPPTYFVFEPWA